MMTELVLFTEEECNWLLDHATDFQESTISYSWERDPMVCAIMKKKVDKPFEIPQQHLYSGEKYNKRRDRKEI